MKVSCSACSLAVYPAEGGVVPEHWSRAAETRTAMQMNQQRVCVCVCLGRLPTDQSGAELSCQSSFISLFFSLLLLLASIGRLIGSLSITA